MTQEFLGELHLHGHHSDGLNTIEDMVKRAKELDYKVLALTDHGRLGGVVQFQNECNKVGIKGIVGTEAYLRLPEPIAKPSSNSASQRYHMTMWSSGLEGYNNLVALHNASHRNMEVSRGNKFPIMTFDMIKEYNLANIFLGTGCVSSATMHDNFDVADEYIKFLIKQFGKDNVYAEIQRHEIIKDKCGTVLNSWKRPLEFSKIYDLQTVFTSDCHAAYPAQLEYLELATSTAKGYSFTACAMESKEDIRQVAIDVIGEEETDKAFEGIKNLTDKIETPDLQRVFELPECDDLILELKQTLLQNLEKDISENGDKLGEQVLRDRLQKEWDLNERWNFWRYFAICWDIMRFAHENNISTNARGSAGGSYILYLLNIIQLHPVKYGLYFERFLTESRLSANELCDIDLDCSSKKRHLIQEYANERWGMVGVVAYSTYSHSALIRFIGRVWGNVRGYPMDAQVIADASNYEAYNYDDKGVVVSKTETFEKFCKHAEFIEPMYKTMIGTIKNETRHACALIIRDGDVAVPIENYAAEPVVAYVESGKDQSLRYIGRVKIDLLGLSSLDILDEIRDLTGINAPKEVLPNDPAFTVYNNNSLGGLFSFDTPVARMVNTKNAGYIECLEDLAYQTSVSRTGPMTQGWHLITKQNPMDTSQHPEVVRGIFDKTNGVISTQEQIMELYALMAYGKLDDLTLQEGVVALKSLVPKSFHIAEEQWWKDKYQELKDKFINGGIKYHNLTKQYMEDLFGSLGGFIKYGLNKSHALSLVGVSARMAWYKYHYAEAFWTVVLNDTPSNKEHLDQVIRYFVEATRFGGVNITAPTINTASDEYTLNMELKQVQMPLTSIHGLGPKLATTIFNEREENGLFKSLSEFNERCKVSSSMKKLLYECGVFDGLKTNDIDKDLLELGIRECKEYKVRGDKWNDEDVSEIVIKHIESTNKSVLITDIFDNKWIIDDEHTKTKIRGNFLNGLMLKVKTNDNYIIEFAKFKYIEESPELLTREQAIRKAYGFAWDAELIKYYEFAEANTLNKFCGYVCEIEEERKTKSTTQYSIKLESGKRIWWLKYDRTSKKWLTKKGLKACQEAGVEYISPNRIPELQLGDFIGGTLFTSRDKETGEDMTYGQVMSYKIF